MILKLIDRYIGGYFWQQRYFHEYKLHIHNNDYVSFNGRKIYYDSEVGRNGYGSTWLQWSIVFELGSDGKFLIYQCDNAHGWKSCRKANDVDGIWRELPFGSKISDRYHKNVFLKTKPTNIERL